MSSKHSLTSCCFGVLKKTRKNKIEESRANKSVHQKCTTCLCNASDLSDAQNILDQNKNLAAMENSMEKVNKELEKEPNALFIPDNYLDSPCIAIPHGDVHGKKIILENIHASNPNKFGRAISQPVDPDDHMIEAFKIGEYNDGYEVVTHCVSKRRLQMQSRGKRPSRSLYGVSPDCKFGPKGYLASASSAVLTIPDPSNQKLNWTKEPLSVLIIRKHLDESVMIPFRDLVIWLVETKKMVVFVEQSVMKDSVLKHDADFKSLRDRLSTFKEGDDLTDKVDFIICLGGDGTLLYVSSLFQRSVPPVMAFNMGSLGFLTPFRFGKDYKTEVSKVMQGSASLLLRYRLKCVVVRHDPVTKEDIPHVKNIQKEDAWTKIHKLVLNEVVVDRGPSSYLCNLELYIENRLVTSVQGDGLIISTPSGSTAYAVAAGASMIHPSVPCILITPICPHSLSFRPIVVPAGVELKVNLSPDARGTAMVSFDGRDRKEIHQGDSLRITTAAFPVPSICAADQIEDWFDGLANCLNWNIRHHQRPLQNASSFTSIDSLESPDPQNMTNNSSSADTL